MNKRLIIFLVIALIAVAGYFYLQSRNTAPPESAALPPPADVVPPDLTDDLDAAVLEDLGNEFKEIDNDLRSF